MHHAYMREQKFIANPENFCFALSHSFRISPNDWNMLVTRRRNQILLRYLEIEMWWAMPGKIAGFAKLEYLLPVIVRHFSPVVHGE